MVHLDFLQSYFQTGALLNAFHENLNLIDGV
jgi:hypothetical protein